MDSNWWLGVLQGIFGSVLYDLLLAGAVAALLAYLKARKEKLAGPTLYGLAGFTMIMVLAVTFIGRPLLSKQQPETNSENVQENIKVWADKFSFGIQKQPDDKFVFLYVLTTATGRPIDVGQPKDTPGYLQFLSNVMLSTDLQNKLQALPQEQKQRFTDEISLELARSRINYALLGNFQGVVTIKKTPIAGLTEYSFLTYMDELDSATVQVGDSLRLALPEGPIMLTPHPVTSVPKK